MKKSKLINYFFILIILLLIFIYFIFFQYNNLFQIRKAENEKMDNVNITKYLTFFDDKIYLVYENKFIIECNSDIYIKKGVLIETLIKNKNYKRIIDDLNDILPVKLEGYFINKDIPNIDNIIDMPYLDIEGIKYISDVALDDIFQESYYQKQGNKNNKIIIDLINGTNDFNYIKKVSNVLKKKIGGIINISENGEESKFTYITPIDIDKQIENEIVDLISVKYIKKNLEPQINTMANVVILLGNDKVENFKIRIISKIDDKNNYNKLKKNGYNNIEKIITKDKIEFSKIVCTEEDYYIAQKISKILNIENLEIDNDEKDIINVFITGGK